LGICLESRRDTESEFFAERVHQLLVEMLQGSLQPLLLGTSAPADIASMSNSIRDFRNTDTFDSSGTICRAYVFFSSPVPRNLLKSIKDEESVMARVVLLREV